MTANAEVAVPKASPVTRNGTPSPAQYTASSTAPREAEFDVPAAVTIAPRVGPVHGVQASAKAAPVRAGPLRPARAISRSTCHSRLNAGTNGAHTNTIPIRMISPPETFSAAGPV